MTRPTIFKTGLDNKDSVRGGFVPIIRVGEDGLGKAGFIRREGGVCILWVLTRGFGLGAGKKDKKQDE